MENDSRYLISHPSGGQIEYQAHEDGHISGTFVLYPGHEVTLGITAEQAVNGRIDRMADRKASEEHIFSHSSGLVLNMESAELTTLNGDVVRPTLTEAEILAALLGKQNRIVTYAEFADILGKEEKDIPEVLKVYVRRIRRKIGDNPAKSSDFLIKNVRNFGYVIEDQER